MLRILFVEDNDPIRELTLCLLEGPAREVVACSSAEEALTLFARSPADVVITDISLPHMSGIELARKIRHDSPDTWLIFASGYQIPAALENLGPNVRSLRKPFEADEVDRLLAEVAASRHVD